MALPGRKRDGDDGHHASPLPPPPPQYLPPSSQPSTVPSFTLPPQPSLSTTSSSSVTALAESQVSFTPTTFSTMTTTNMFHDDEYPPPPPPSSSGSSDWTPSYSPTESIATATIFITKTTSVSSSGTEEPTLLPQPTMLPAFNDSGRTQESMAVKAVVVIICAFLFLAICYVCFRFCPPIRNRWLAFKERRDQERLKRLDMEDLPATIVMTMTPAIAQPPMERWTSTGPRLPVPVAAARRLGMSAVETERRVSARPPSYRSNWTVSGASWVANGFRSPEGLSHGAGRSEANRTQWFGQSDGPARSSMDSASDQTSLSARVSTMSSGSRQVSRGGGGLGEVVRDGLRESSNAGNDSSRSISRSPSMGTRRASQMSEVSRMSSTWSEQRSSVALRPPPPYVLPIGVAR